LARDYGEHRVVPSRPARQRRSLLESLYTVTGKVHPTRPIHRSQALLLLNGTKVYVLAVVEHGSRRVRVLGATDHPVQSWVVQQGRNLLIDLGDAGTRAKFVLHDRDASFTQAFDACSRRPGSGLSVPPFRHR